MQITAQELAKLLQGEVDGNPDTVVSKLAKIEEAESDALSFIANPKYERYATETNAGILVVSKALKVDGPTPTLIRVEDPYSSFSLLLSHFSGATTQSEPKIEDPSFVHEDANVGAGTHVGAFSYISEGAEVGEECYIAPNVFIGKDVKIGKGSKIHANVSIYHDCVLGENCIIHAGVVVGSDGFGFAPQADGSFVKVPQTGNVVLEDNVEIGANTVLDRATLGSTVIRKGVKLDNLIQIAHNVDIGDNTVVAAQTGISGSTKLGKQCMIGGQVGIVGHINIADKVKVNAQSGVSKSVEEEGKALTGSPAYDFRQAYRDEVMIRKLSTLFDRVASLEKRLQDKSE